MTENYWFRILTIFIFQYSNNSIMLSIVFNNLFKLRRSRPFVGEFDIVSKRWYLTVGVPIVFAIFIQIFMPHLGLFAQWVKVSAIRFWDRRCTFNKRITRQITQEEYENLYTGPEFIL